jgi:hypothetical protein
MLVTKKPRKPRTKKKLDEGIIIEDEPIGEPIGEVIGEPIGEVIGEPIGEVIGEPIGEVIGEPVKSQEQQI